MRLNISLLVVLLALTASNAQAALKDHDVKYRLAIREDDRLVHETRRQNYSFQVEIVNDTEGVKPETFKDGRPFITASKGERYSVRLYNPLPVRVAVNLTVDGLNSITGKPSGITDGQKWMIDPYSSVTIPGWQVSGEETRRFFFTDKPKSYAKWRGDELGKDLSANCGVIGAAYFWNQEELNQYYDNHPIVRYTQRSWPFAALRSKAASGMSSAPAGNLQSDRQASGGPNFQNEVGAPASAPEAMDMDVKKEAPQEQAGTGMGERETHPTIQVAFNYNTGMYSLSQALVIYYDFAKVSSPNPFPAVGYSPEMP